MQLPRLCLVAVATIALTSPAWAADNDTLTVGFSVSQTGKLNTDSIAQMRGFELWRDQVNAKGGIKVGNKAYNINSSAMTTNRRMGACSSSTRA